MQRYLHRIVVCAILGIVGLPSAAHAETYVSPFVGVVFGNDSGGGKPAVGLDAGWLAAGIFGFEADFGYVPDFFGDAGALGSNSVMDVMGNLVISIPAGGTRGAGFHLPISPSAQGCYARPLTASAAHQPRSATMNWA